MALCRCGGHTWPVVARGGYVAWRCGSCRGWSTPLVDFSEAKHEEIFGHPSALSRQARALPRAPRGPRLPKPTGSTSVKRQGSTQAKPAGG